MTSFPFSQQRVVPFRAPSKSTDYNEAQEEHFHDITNLFNLANDIDNKLEMTNSKLETMGRFQQLRIQQLENNMFELETEIANVGGNSDEKSLFAFPSDMYTETVLENETQAYIDKYSGIVHLPITGKMTSKAYVYDQIADRIILPDTLLATATSPTRTSWVVKESDPKNAFNGNNDDYWHRRIIMPMEYVYEGEVKAELHVSLPDNIISSQDVNMVYLQPFLLNSLHIDKIEYKYENEWNLLPSWPIDAQTNEPIRHEYAGSLKFCIPNTAMKELKITMTQPNWMEENHNKVYHFGMQEVGILHTHYESKVGHVNIPFTMVGESANRIIEGVKPTFKNASVLTDQTEAKSSIFSYQIYTQDEEGLEEYTKDTLPILVSHKRILIKASLYPDPQSGITPALERVELIYKNV